MKVVWIGGPTAIAKFQLFAKDNPHHVLWSPDGKTLFYNPRPGGLESVSFRTQSTVSFGSAVAVPNKFQLGPMSAPRAYDITPSGKFVGLIPAGQTESYTTIAPQLQVVLNWFEELKQHVPTH